MTIMRMLTKYSCEGCGYFCTLPLGKVLLYQLRQVLMTVIQFYKVTLSKNTKLAMDP
jgi:hypothetical protein